MKHIFEDMRDLKPILKRVIELKDKHKVLRIFEYFLTKNEMEDKEFEKLIYDLKGDKIMIPLFERWEKRGIQRGIEKGMEQGIEQGMQNEKIIIAKNLLVANMDINFISKTTGLNIKEIKSIKI